MPPSRDPRIPSRQLASPTTAQPRPRRWPSIRLPWIDWRSPHLRRDLLMLAVGLIGAVATTTLIGLIWRDQDRGSVEKQLTAATLAEKPRRAVTVLVIGSDADSISDTTNNAAPSGPPNADALMLVRVNPEGPLQVLNIPIDLAVLLPGETEPRPLGQLYEMGGVALLSDTVAELIGLDRPGPDRYMVLPRGALRAVVGELGGLEVKPPRTMRYEDKAQKLSIDLQSGLQRLDGEQVEGMARFRDKWLGESGRRSNHQLLVTSLRERLGQPELLGRLPVLIDVLEKKVDTNLTARESLSLLAAGLDDDRPIQFGTLPLTPAKPEQAPLRQLDPEAKGKLWKAP